MSFAVKINKDESLKLSGTALVSLVITNIALGPKEKCASLFIHQKQIDDTILIVSLQRGRNESYSCSIKLLLNNEHSEKLQARDGEIHILGNYQLIHNPEHLNILFENPIKIRRKVKEIKQVLSKPPSLYIEEQNSVKNRPRRSLVAKLAPMLQTKSDKESRKKRSMRNSQVKEKSLLQMMKNIDKDDVDSDDDQSYEQQSQQDESQSRSNENQQQQKNKVVEDHIKVQKQGKMTKDDVKRNSKKKSSWATMLQGANDQDSDEDAEQYSQQSESSQSLEAEQEDDDQTPQVKPRKIKHQQQNSKSQDKIQISQNKVEEIASNMANVEVEVVNQSTPTSSSFQFQIPKGLPSFVVKK